MKEVRIFNGKQVIEVDDLKGDCGAGPKDCVFIGMDNCGSPCGLGHKAFILKEDYVDYLTWLLIQ